LVRRNPDTAAVALAERIIARWPASERLLSSVTHLVGLRMIELSGNGAFTRASLGPRPPEALVYAAQPARHAALAIIWENALSEAERATLSTAWSELMDA
jgi:hypothetical protein